MHDTCNRKGTLRLKMTAGPVKRGEEQFKISYHRQLEIMAISVDKVSMLLFVAWFYILRICYTEL